MEYHDAYPVWASALCPDKPTEKRSAMSAHSMTNDNRRIWGPPPRSPLAQRGGLYTNEWGLQVDARTVALENAPVQLREARVRSPSTITSTASSTVSRFYTLPRRTTP